MRKIFLACPYSHADENVVQERFLACNKVAANFIEAGHAVFSQVTMSHPINLQLQHTDKAEIGKMWAPVDALFLAMMEELIILDLPGWDQSAGIKREIEFYQSRNQRVSLWSEVEHEFK
ncbi:Domain of uncharacterised function (DUF1937) [Serratia liquefaciens]|uniref:DUF1937 family protein n=1 Tax=Serratia liquefaciens TaxID=614 RepID=UPI002184161D|nr:DUF1937 family protein [Serratia liquefaciens]CAI2424552.1 Domain of uncharacterised function (DUF1937) [Serratia liquefaciens]